MVSCDLYLFLLSIRSTWLQPQQKVRAAFSVTSHVGGKIFVLPNLRLAFALCALGSSVIDGTRSFSRFYHPKSLLQQRSGTMATTSSMWCVICWVSYRTCEPISRPFPRKFPEVKHSHAFLHDRGLLCISCTYLIELQVELLL